MAISVAAARPSVAKVPVKRHDLGSAVSHKPKRRGSSSFRAMADPGAAVVVADQDGASPDVPCNSISFACCILRKLGCAV